MPEQRQQRSVRNYVINPEMQFRLSLHFVIFGLFIMSIMTFVFYTQIEQIETALTSAPVIPLDEQMMIVRMLGNLIKICLIFYFIFLVTSIFYGLILSHRIAGPMHAILAYIEELKNGNYSSNRKLRDSDELVPIMDSLHDLAEKLRSR